MSQIKNKSKRIKSNIAILISQIILCLIALAAITFGVIFLLKLRQAESEKKDLAEQLAVYQNPDDPYYNTSQVQAFVDEARIQGANDAKDTAKQEILDFIKLDLITDNSAIDTIRTLYPDDIVMVDSAQYYFIPIDHTLKSFPLDYAKFETDEKGFISYKDEAVNAEFGIDVSKYQEKINWSKVANSDVDFAIIRVATRGYSEGDIIPDNTFETNIKGALANKIGVSVYFLTQATSNEEAKAEAEFVLDAIEPYKITYPVVLDVEAVGGEKGRGNNLTVEERTEYCITFCEMIRNAGYTPMIYGNLKTFMLMLDMSKLEDYSKWFAGYTDTPYFPYDFDMWQYSDTGRIDGISEPVDLNISFWKKDVQEE